MGVLIVFASRLGIVGTGRVAEQALAPALREVPGAVLWSVLGRDRDRARAFADRHRSPRLGPDPVELAPVNPFAAALADFTGAIAARRDPEVTGEVGVRNLAVMLRAVPGTAADPRGSQEPPPT